MEPSNQNLFFILIARFKLERSGHKLSVFNFWSNLYLCANETDQILAILQKFCIHQNKHKQFGKIGA